MTEDSRCCGTGTCMINAEGRCWCGQQWDGETLCSPSNGAARAETQETKPAMAATGKDDRVEQP